MSAVTAIVAEMKRQDLKWGQQNHRDGTSRRYELERDHAIQATDLAARNRRLTWRHILDEEVMEAFAETHPEKLQVELAQIAAVCAQWWEAIERRKVVP